MDDLSKLSVLVVDGGGFPFIAERLARDFARVGYWTPAFPTEFPKSYTQLVGKGLPGVERIKKDDVYRWIADGTADLVVFCDVNWPGLQYLCRKAGLRVWGIGDAETIETNRWELGDVLQKHNLARGERELIKGLDALEARLIECKDVYVKVNQFRGDMETTHWQDEFTGRPWLQNLRNELGVAGHEFEFVIEHPIEGVEIGFDGYVVDGKYPSPALFGYEVKDAGYIGKMLDKLPTPLQECNDKLADHFANSRGFYSNEVRVGKDGVPYLIDPTCRCPSPPSQLYCELWKNFSEIIWEGAGGVLVNPESVAEYGCIAIITTHSEYGNIEMPIKYPKEYSNFVKFRSWYVRNGQSHIFPQGQVVPQIGAVVGIGDDIEDAIKMATEIADTIEGYSIEIKTDAFSKAKEVIEQGEKEVGIKF